jgi:hypothetical protein
MLKSQFSEGEVESIRKLLQIQSLEICALPEWGSSQRDYRSLIHFDLSHKVCSSSSISHAPDMGGYACTQDVGVWIGFDIELSSRVTAKITQRVCKTQQELISAPSPAALWTAKEAAYKSLRTLNQPKVITEISIHGWENINLFTNTFDFSSAYPNPGFTGRGAVIQSSKFHFAFFVLRPN